MMSGPIKLRERSNRPRYSFDESDEEDPIIFPRKHGKCTAKYVKIDGNYTVSYFSFLC